MTRVGTRAGSVAVAALVLASLGLGWVPAGAQAPGPERTVTYSVAVRGRVATDVEGFAAHAATTLADPRGWGLGGAVAYERVPVGGDFTLWLAEASTVPSFSSACSAQYSCRVGRHVVINETRWRTATPAWPLGLDEYQHYVVIHEVGHWLGLGHAACPGAGQAAPVMLQQSIAIGGCRYNTWPLEGERQQVARNLGVAARPVVAATWHAAQLLPGGHGVRSSPEAAAVRGASTIAVAVLGSDGGIHTQGWNGAQWSGFVSAGSPPVGVAPGSGPAVVSWAPGRYDLFVRGADDRLWQRYSTDGGITWSVWAQPVPDGVLASSPEAVSWAPDRIDLFVLGTDGQIHQRYWDGTNWNPAWIPHGRPRGTSITGDPAAASWAAGRLDLFVRDADGRLHQRFWSGTGWSTWFQPPGTEAGTLAAPGADGSALDAASWGPGHLVVTTRGTDDRLYLTTYAAGWSGWLAPFPNHFSGAPAATSTGHGQLDVLVRGTDDQAYRFRFGP